MSTYVIGDVQGCDDTLQKLLAHIHFDETVDTLWFTGDLVNRGPDSLAVLRFVKSLGERAITVLGNHDLHLLAVYYVNQAVNKGDTLSAVLAAPDADSLMHWLRHQPFIHYDKKLNAVLTHAGIAPCWTLEKSIDLAREAQLALSANSFKHLLSHMYGNQPNVWRNDLAGVDRLRCIINYFTRMRFCEKDGALNLSYKGELKEAPRTLVPWFNVSNRESISATILFGHWAALNGETGHDNIIALDTGCVWGQFLTALCLESGERFSIRAGACYGSQI